VSDQFERAIFICHSSWHCLEYLVVVRAARGVDMCKASRQGLVAAVTTCEAQRSGASRKRFV